MYRWEECLRKAIFHAPRDPLLPWPVLKLKSKSFRGKHVFVNLATGSKFHHHPVTKKTWKHSVWERHCPFGSAYDSCGWRVEEAKKGPPFDKGYLFFVPTSYRTRRGGEGRERLIPNFDGVKCLQNVPAARMGEAGKLPLNVCDDDGDKEGGFAGLFAKPHVLKS